MKDRGDSMKCSECGGVYHKRHGDLMLYDDSIGPYDVHNVSYEECAECGDLLFSPDTIRAIEKERDLIKEKHIRNEPVDRFISATEAAEILGISRQALHKHRRVRRGFIYSTTIGGMTVYHKESVELFKSAGDGRFSLYRPKRVVSSTSYNDIVRYDQKRSFGSTTVLETHPFEKLQTLKSESGVSYV